MDQKSSAGQSTQPIGSTPKRTRWDATPLVKHDLNSDGPNRLQNQTPSRMMEQTPSRFSQTPLRRDQNQTPRKWDDKTPLIGGATPGYAGMTPTPSNLKTPGIMQMSSSKLDQIRWQKQLEQRNKAYTDDELDMLLPGGDDGYQILKTPENYQPDQKGKISGMVETEIYKMPSAESKPFSENLESAQSDLPPIKPEEAQIFWSPA